VEESAVGYWGGGVGGFGYRQERLVGEEGQAMDEQSAGGGFTEAGVAIVVEGQVRLTRPNRQMWCLRPPEQAVNERGPGVLEARLLGDGFYGDAFEAGAASNRR